MIPHHVVAGPQDAPALVLSNSLGTDLTMWDPQAEALAASHRLIRYDTRGHGASPTPPGPYALADLGGDVLDLLDHLGIAKAHVAGLSLGGMTAMWLAINAPERVDRLALLCTAPQLGPESMWIERARTVREQGTQAIVDGTLERWLTAGYRATHDTSAIRERFVATDDEGYANCCAAIQHMDQRAGLPTISAPTLIVAGAQDPSTPPDPAFAHAIPGARFEVLDPGAHLINVERPDAVTALLLEHV
ncbi:MAG TPA: 3-oxoadipate enol-lactonase [Solirubrobacter sp.]|nr:3-oxoadipate enol-lactonase [Solirubrobacter sp.]